MNILHGKFVVLYQKDGVFERGWTSKHAWFLGPMSGTLPRWGFCPTIHSRWFSTSSTGWGLGNSSDGNPYACLHSCAFCMQNVDGSFEIHVSKSGEQWSWEYIICQFWSYVSFWFGNGINIPNLGFATFWMTSTQISRVEDSVRTETPMNGSP